MEDLLGNKCLYCMTGAYDSVTGVCPVCRHDRTYQNADHQLSVGAVLGGRYLVGRALGQGGFGVTYIGWDMYKNEKIAIKEYFPSGCAARKRDNYTLSPYSDSESQNIYESGKTRFLDEAKRLKEINDVANVVRVSAFFAENNTAYIIMDYVEGITFKKYLFDRGGLTSLADALEKLHPVVTALSQIHKKNMLHRDISPDNIILSPLGAVLIDFGAAREYSFETPTSKTINVKTGYAPMEQYDTHGQQGPWTDVFAFASTIYRAVTGILPANAIKRSENSAELRLPHELNQDINPAEEQVLLRGMEIDIQKRYQDIDSFYRDLIAAHATPGVFPVAERPPKIKLTKDKAKSTHNPTYNPSFAPAQSLTEGKQKKNVFALITAILFLVSSLYSFFFFIGVTADDELYPELMVQLILGFAVPVAAAVFLLRYFSKGKNDMAAIIQIALLALWLITLLSAIIFDATYPYYRSSVFDDLFGMLLYTHVPLLTVLNGLFLAYTKKEHGKWFEALSLFSKNKQK